MKKAIILIRVCIKIVQKGSKEIPLTLELPRSDC